MSVACAAEVCERFLWEGDTSNKSFELLHVNYVGGSRQLRWRFATTSPLPWQGAGGGKNWPLEATPNLVHPIGLSLVQGSLVRLVSPHGQIFGPGDGVPCRGGGAHEPEDPMVRRRRGAHHQPLDAWAGPRLACH